MNKALADFAHRGWIRLEGKSVLICDSERLARRARWTRASEAQRMHPKSTFWRDLLALSRPFVGLGGYQVARR